MQILGLILAGGQSSRMGGGDKAFALLGGRPLIRYAMDALARQVKCQKSGTDSLIINTNSDCAGYTGFGLPVIADDIAGFAGPLAGIIAALDFCVRAGCGITHVLSLPVDTPFAPHDLALRLRRKLLAEHAQIAVACSGGRDHPVVALWPVALATELRHYLCVEGLASVARVQDKFAVARVHWSDRPHDPFFNVNTRAAMTEAESLLKHIRSQP